MAERDERHQGGSQGACHAMMTEATESLSGQTLRGDYNTHHDPRSDRTLDWSGAPQEMPAAVQACLNTTATLLAKLSLLSKNDSHGYSN
jgi:hypothetical protein